MSSKSVSSRVWVCGLLVFTVVVATRCGAQVQLGDALRKLAMLAPDPCELNGVEDLDKHPEMAVFGAATKLVEDRLNAGAGTPEQRAREAMAEVALESVEAQPGWPEESRFRGEVVKAGPALVVTMVVRTRARWFAFGQVDGRWKQVGNDDGALDDAPRRLMQVYGLPGGGPGMARFLAARVFFGCAGSSGITYTVEEWDSKQQGGYVVEVLKQDGAFGMDEAADGRGPSAKEPFWPVGRLVTAGPVLQLPYCLFTGIDTWDNPSLCALDRYDLRGGVIRFLSRRYNRPELVPVAKAMEYSRQHDLPATRAYCASDALARRLVVEGTPGPDMNLEVVRRGRGKRVWFGDRESWFDVEVRGGRWVIVGMSGER